MILDQNNNPNIYWVYLNSSIWYFERCALLSRGLSRWTIYVVDPPLKHLIKWEIIRVCDMHSNIDNKIIRVCFMWSCIISNFLSIQKYRMNHEIIIGITSLGKKKKKKKLYRSIIYPKTTQNHRHNGMEV